MKTVLDISRYSRQSLLYLLAIFTSTSYGSASASEKQGFLTENVVVFSDEDTEEAAKEHPMIGLQAPYWEPTTSDMKSIKAALSAYLRLHRRDLGSDVTERLDEYRLQLLGYSDGGAKFVLVNGFCKSFWGSHPSWKDSLVFVLDGGSCLFHASYGIQGSKIVRFEVNRDP